MLVVVIVCIVVEKRLIEEVRKNDTLIIVGETGSGKTTRRLHLILLYTVVYDSALHNLAFLEK